VSIRKTNVSLQRFSWAFSVLVLTPTGVIQTVRHPSDYHMIFLGCTIAWTALMGVAYRRAVTKWMEDEDSQ
jgi:hypothetical protein